MHELSLWYSSWSGTLYSWARTAVGIVLWFWVVSGAVFALRFVLFLFLEKHGAARSLTPSAALPFSMDGFRQDQSRLDSTEE